MKSLNRAYVPELDHIRGFASLLVLLYHWVAAGYPTTGTIPKEGPWIRSLLLEGETGVGLFLVLSGFVLARGALGKPIAYSKFIKNRVLRIAPLTVFVFVFAIYGNRGDYTFESVIAPFLLLTNTPLRFTDHTNLSAAAWTIAVEFQFYLIAPFIFSFASDRGLKGFLLPMILFAFLARILVLIPNWPYADALTNISYATIIGRLNQFLLGVSMAYLWPRIQARLGDRRIGGALMALALVAIVLFCHALHQGGGTMAWHPWQVVMPELEGAIWCCFIAGYLIARPFERAPTAAKALTWLGVISFSTYMLHRAMVIAFWNAYAGLGFHFVHGMGTMLALAPLGLVVILPFSALCYACIERPFLEMRGRYVPAKPEMTVVASAHAALAGAE